MAIVTKTAHSSFETLMFLGKYEDFAYVSQLLVARISLLELREVILDTEYAADSYDAELEKLEVRQIGVWCDLVQCRNKKAFNLSRICKLNGPEPWRTL